MTLGVGQAGSAEKVADTSSDVAVLVSVQQQSAQYPEDWQRRLLAVQLAYAATLQPIDPVETGSINPLDQ
jgi:hypothetical protein